MKTINYEASFEQSPNLALILDLNFFIISVSNAYLKATQTVKKNIIGQDLFQIFPNNQSDTTAFRISNVRTTLNRVIRTKIAEKIASVKYDISIPECNGEGKMQKYWQIIFTPVLDEFNEVTYVLVYLEDVTENASLVAQLALEKKLLQQVTESEKRYNLLLMKSPFAMTVLKGQDMVIALANEKIKNIWGKGNNVEGRKILDILPEFGATEFPTWLNKVYTTGTSFYENELFYLTQEKGFEEESYFDFICQPYLEADESISGVTVIVYEVTERVLAQKKLEESKQWFQSAAEGLHEYLRSSNIGGQTEGHPQDLSLLTGLNKVNYQGLGWSDPIYSPEQASTLQAWLTATLTKMKFIFDHRVKMSDGSWGQFSINAIPLFNPNGSMVQWVSEYIDVSKKRRAQDVIKKIEQKFIHLFDSIPLKICQADINGEMFLYNEEWYKDTGLSFEALKGKGRGENIDLEDVETSHKNMEYSFVSGNMEMENGIVNKQKQYKWHLDKAVAIKNKKGLITLWVGRDTIITEQKEQKEMFEIGVNGRTWAIDKANRILVDQMEKECQLENSIFFANNLKVQQAQINKSDLLIKQKERVKVINQEISFNSYNQEEYLARRTLDFADSIHTFRSMMETIPQIAWTNKVDMDVDFFNQKWYDYTGLNFNQSLESGWQKIVHPSDIKDTIHQLKSILKAVKGGGFQTRLQSSNTNYRWHFIQLKPIKNEAGVMQLWIGTATDIQELKLLQQQKADFISIASNELKTPVTTLKLSLQLLNELKKTLSPPLIVDLITQANRSLDKFTILIDDLLDVNKANDDQLHLNKKLINLFDAIADCCNHVQLADQYTLRIEGDVEGNVYADAERINQVMVNFVNNAIKFAPHSKEIKVLIEKVNGMVKVSVIDKGPGINPEKIPHLFERYYQVDFNGRKRSTGLGVGLFIASEIIKRHNGQIGVDNIVGKGCSFWFTLPL